MFGPFAPHIAWVFQASHRGSFSNSSVGTLRRFTATGIPDVGFTLPVAMRSAIRVCVIVSPLQRASLGLILRSCVGSDSVTGDTLQIVDEPDDLPFVFAVASSLVDPARCAIADPVHSDICEGKKSKNPIVENDVGVVDSEK